jgi:Domain of unknown function (DUF4259)
MGAWGTGSFANDTANDWAADFVEVGDLSFVRKVLEKVAATTAEEYLQERISCHDGGFPQTRTGRHPSPVS